MNKALIAPIVAGFALIAKQLFGYEFTSEFLDGMTNLILALVALFGVFMDPRKSSPTPSEVEHIQQKRGGGVDKNDGYGGY